MSELLQRAFAFAVKKHAGTNRDGEAALPYATHVADVARILRLYGGVTDEEVLAAALLHDTVEDTETTNEEIREAFGARVAEIVAEVTREEPPDSELEGLSPDDRFWHRNNYLLAEIDAMSDAAKQIKLADRLSNLEEARITKPLNKLSRYNRQSTLILEHIDEGVNPRLHRKLAKLNQKIWNELAED